MTTVSLGTINLEDLCGCPSECPECCGVATDCCSSVGIPETLYADVTQSVPLCATATITLTWNSGAGYWEGDGTVECGALCGSTQAIYLRLRCLTPSNIFELTASCDNFANSATDQHNTLVCDPFDATFVIVLPAAGCASCPATGFAVEVTE